jgi:N-acetylmuramoyl-L-alanine amidase
MPVPKPNTPRNTTPTASPDAPGPKPLVVIDPGHGGQDPGAIGPGGIKEKNITLALGRALRDKLEESGQYRVMMTRDKDVFIKLRDRVTFAREHGAALFISLHADSIDKPGVQGASIYTLSEKASDKETQKLADRENRADLIAGIDVDTDDQEVASILVDLTMRDTVNQSRYFASRLSSIFASEKIRMLERPTRSAGFAVLKAPDVPSILVEAGFMSNRREAEMLNTPEHRNRIARALKKGIDAYFEQVRKNQRI